MSSSWGRDVHFFCSQLYLQHLYECLEHSRCSIIIYRIHEGMVGWSEPPRMLFPLPGTPFLPLLSPSILRFIQTERAPIYLWFSIFYQVGTKMWQERVPVALLTNDDLHYSFFPNLLSSKSSPKAFSCSGKDNRYLASHCFKTNKHPALLTYNKWQHSQNTLFDKWWHTCETSPTQESEHIPSKRSLLPFWNVFLQPSLSPQPAIPMQSPICFGSLQMCLHLLVKWNHAILGFLKCIYF